MEKHSLRNSALIMLTILFISSCSDDDVEYKHYTELPGNPSMTDVMERKSKREKEQKRRDETNKIFGFLEGTWKKNGKSRGIGETMRFTHRGSFQTLETGLIPWIHWEYKINIKENKFIIYGRKNQKHKQVCFIDIQLLKPTLKLNCSSVVTGSAVLSVGVSTIHKVND